MTTPQDHGARGDGATDDAAAFQAALDAGGPVHVPAAAAGYQIGTPLVLRGGTARGWQVLTADRGARLFGPQPLLRIAGWYVDVRGLTLDLAGAPTATPAVLLDTSGGNLYKLRLADLLFQNCPLALADALTTAHFVADMQVQDCHTWLIRGGPQILLSRSRGLVLFDGFIIDYTQNAALPGLWDGAVFTDFVGLELERFDVMGANENTPASNGPCALRLSAPPGYGISVWLTRVLIDGWKGAGIRLDGIDNLFARDVESYASFGDAIRLTRCTNSLLQNVAVYGALGIPGALAGAVGLSLTGCQHVSLTGLRSVRNTGACVVLDGSTDCKLSGTMLDGAVAHLSGAARNVIA